MLDTDLLALIESFYDSVLDEQHWSRSLGQVLRYLDGTALAYLVANPRNAAIVQADSLQLDPEFTQRYVQHYASKDARLGPALAKPIGCVLTGEQLVGLREFERSELYADILRPADIPHMMMSWVDKSPTLYHSLVIEGTHRHGPFGVELQNRYRRLVPHLHRAVRLRGLLQQYRQAHRARMDIFESLPFGVALLRRSGEVIETTAILRRLLAAGTALRYTGGKIAALDPGSDLALQRLVHATLRPRRTGIAPGGAVPLKRRGEGPRLTVFACPLNCTELAFLSTQPAALLLVVDPTLYPSLRLPLIQSSLGLTKAEALIATYLFEGRTLRDTSMELRLSINTCKTQLKAIYAKTGCRTHVELAKCIMLSTLGRDSG